MFKLRGEVLGPVPAREIVDHMLVGEIDESTQLSTEEGSWKNLQQRAPWMPFLLHAKAHIRAQQARAEAERAARKRRLQNLINVFIGGFFLVLLSFAITYLIIVQGPMRNEEAVQAWSNRHVPLFAVAGTGPITRLGPAEPDAESDFSGISVEQILVEDAPDLVAIKPGSSKKRKRRRKIDRPADKPSTTKVDRGVAVASIGNLSKQEIISKVYRRTNMNRLKGCLMAEIKRNEDLPGRVVLNFSVKNDGRVHNVQLDDIRLENGALQRCFNQKLARLHFRTYAGQVQNVTVPFDWKR
jgi:hypothetical protein